MLIPSAAFEIYIESETWKSTGCKYQLCVFHWCFSSWLVRKSLVVIRCILKYFTWVLLTVLPKWNGIFAARWGWSVQKMGLFSTAALLEMDFHRSSELRHTLTLLLSAKCAISSFSNINLKQLWSYFSKTVCVTYFKMKCYAAHRWCPKE